MTTHPYAEPRALADNLWELRGEWSNKLGRRMTVVRLGSGEVFVHNAFRLTPADLGWLHQQGPVRGVIAPNKFHCSDAGWLVGECTGAELYAPTSKLAHFEAQGLKPKALAAFPTELAREFECLPMHGTRIEESAFIHHPSRTLILCDLAMNMENVFSGLEGAFMRWNRVGGRFGVTRLTKYLFTKDAKALVTSYRSLLERDFDRVIVNHGAVLESGGQEQLRASVSEIFGSA